MSVLAAQINPIVGDLKGNTAKILSVLEKARALKCELVVFPEMALTGYLPEDLLLHEAFIEEAEKALEEILPKTTSLTVVLGTIRKNPTLQEKPLYNTAAILSNQKLLGFQDKRLLPTYDVFDEKRYFESGTTTVLFKSASFSFGVLICEDMWEHGRFVEQTHYNQDPVQDLIALKPDFIINISSSPYHFGKPEYRLKIAATCAKSVKAPMLLCCQVGGNDQLIFDGYSAAFNAKGELTSLAKGFEEDLLKVEVSKTAPIVHTFDPMEDLYHALILGIRDYFQKLGFKKACLGLSGGVDSAVVACLVTKALGKENVLGVAMPSRYSSTGSLTDAKALATTLGIELKTVSIEAPFQTFLDLFSGELRGLAEENIQARIRGMILMTFSNKEGYLVLSTGNKSELALGYCTLYGDMCGALNVISDLTKTRVYALARWINQKQALIPESSLTKPPSAELKPNQKDSDTLPDYAILDPIIESYVEKTLSIKEIAEEQKLPEAFIQNLVHKIHLAEYKRRQGAPGFRVTPKSFLVGRRYPIVQKWN